MTDSSGKKGVISLPQNTSNLTGGIVLIPGYGKTIKGHITVSSFSKTLTGSITPKGSESALHWYSGPFRYSSIKGFYRAVFRPVNLVKNFLTQNRTAR